MESIEIPLRPFLIFLVVLSRVGGLMTFAPFWSHKAVNFKAKVMMAFVLSLALTPVVSEKIETPPIELSSFTLILIGEVVIGMIFGFSGKIIFSGFELAAHFVSSQMGFSLAGTIDPTTQAQTTVFGIVAQMLGLMVLLGANGHHWFLEGTLKSFSTINPGTFTFSADLLEIFLRLSANAFVIGVTLASPAIIVLLTVEFALEFFGRTAPQFQVFILGFPIKIGVGLWIIGASLYFLPNALRESFAQVFQALTKILTQ